MAQVNRLAKIMGAMGDEDSPDERRAKAMALLWAPNEVLALIAASEDVDLSNVDHDDDHPGPRAGEGDGHYVPNNVKHYPPEDEYDVPPDPDLDPDPDDPDPDHPDPDNPAADAHEPTTAHRGGAGTPAADDHPTTNTDDHRHGENRQDGNRANDDRHDQGAAEASARSGTDVGGERAAAPTGDRGDDAPDRPSSRAGSSGDRADPQNAEPSKSARPADRSSQGTDDSADGRGNSAPDRTERQNSAHWPRPPHRTGRSGSQGLSPKVARQMLKVLAASGLDPARIGPQIVLYHHYAHETLTTGNGTVRLEGTAAMTLHELRNYLHPFSRITVKPVIDLNARQMPVDGYETPARLREHLHLTSPGDAYPWSTYTGRRVQMDHTIAYRPPAKGGPHGQTRLGNLTPLSTFSHRVKTHGGTQARQPRPGTIVWRTRHGLVTITDHTGTHNLGTDPFAQAIWRAACTINGETTDTPRCPDPEQPQGPSTPQPHPPAPCPKLRRISRPEQNIRDYISTIPMPPAQAGPPQPTSQQTATHRLARHESGDRPTWDLLPPRFALTL